MPRNANRYDLLPRLSRRQGRADGDLVLLKRVRAPWPERTPAQLAELVARVARGEPPAREELVLQYVYLVEKFAAYAWRRAGQSLRQSASVDDLRQEGRLGLIRAAELFDPARGASFVTYASTWVRSRVLRFVREYGTTVHVPSARARPHYSREEMAARRARDVDEAVDRAHHYVDVDDVQVAASAEEVEERGRVVRSVVADMLGAGKLTAREGQVLVRRFFGDGEETLEQVGDSFGVSRERVRQVEAEAVAKVRREVLRRYPDMWEG